MLVCGTGSKGGSIYKTMKSCFCLCICFWIPSEGEKKWEKYYVKGEGTKSQDPGGRAARKDIKTVRS